MTHDEAFLHAIREAPDDDTPRLVYADWLDEHGRAARAELIRLQCHQARTPDDPRGADLQRRAEELLREHWEEWVGPLRAVAGPAASRHGEAWLAGGFQPDKARKFRRGFVDELALDAKVFLDRTVEIARVVPLRHLRLWRAGDHAEGLAAAPYLGGVATLIFGDYFTSPLGARGAAALARSPHLGRLRVLQLYGNNVGDAGTAALADAAWLRGLHTLFLSQNEVTAAGAASLAESPHLGRLRSLHLDRNPLGVEGARLLARAPWLRSLRRLSVSNCDMGEEVVEALQNSLHRGAGIEFDFGDEGP